MPAGEPLDVSQDAFFGEVRRRHPDIDIVLLPPELPAEPPPPTPVDELPSIAVVLDAEAQALGAELAAGLDAVASTPRWVVGSAPGSVSREVLLATEDVDATTAAQSLSRSRRVLDDAGWHGLVPEHGMPRVLASRRDPITSRVHEVAVVYVETRRRFVVTIGCGPYVIGALERRRVLGS